MTSSTEEKDDGRELEARVVAAEGVEKQVSGGLCENYSEEEEKVVFIIYAKRRSLAVGELHSLFPPHSTPPSIENYSYN